MVAKIGLTGGIGSGKSTIASCFHELGVYVIDADQISRQLMQPTTPQYHAIVSHFGKGILTTSGAIDRKALGARVFVDPSERRFLETLLHPAIRETMHKQVENHASIYAILEIPLLIEGEQHKRMDRVLVVTCPREVRKKRLISERNMTSDMVKKVMDTQLSDEQRLIYADDIIHNDQPIEEIKSKVVALHRQYLALFDQ